jgi:hypothetical protein
MRLLPATIVYRVALSGLVTARMRWHAAGAPDKST